MTSSQKLADLLGEIRACRICEANLPHGPRPIIQAATSARLLIVGQAPGRRVHASGIPYDDASGERLRRWLGIDSKTFYDPRRVALQPMGFCYPGQGASGDLPPRPECAPRWHTHLAALLPKIEVTVLLGWHATRYYLPKTRYRTLTETVLNWRDYAPSCFPMPHPSPRNIAWFQRHPWFEAETVPALRERLRSVLA